MFRLYAHLFIALNASTVFAIDSHCNKKERVIFNCALANSSKIVSLCAVGSESVEDQYLQYKFGAPGRVELAFPKSGFAEKDQFLFRRIYSGAVSYLRYDLEFDIGHYTYNVYREDSSERGITNGVEIASVKKGPINLRCDKHAVHDFDGAFFLYNVKRDD